MNTNEPRKPGVCVILRAEDSQFLGLSKEETYKRYQETWLKPHEAEFIPMKLVKGKAKY